jgi:GDP-mannose 6-dehydrogenase
MSDVVMPALISSADEAPGGRYDVAYLPEFSREGSAVADHYDASRIVIGERRPGCGKLLLRLFENFDVEKFLTSFEVAELAKFADNSFHALKVAFANEIARFAVRAKATPSQIFDIFLADQKLNISAAYLRPGMAFGGPCLPKDVRALALRMEATGVSAPLMSSILRSNDSHLFFLIEEIEARVKPGSRVLLVGLSFKPATDDVRNSPLVKLANELLDRGYNLHIYDPDFICDHGVDLSTVKSQLPADLAHRLLSEISLSEDWDLVVVAKAISQLQSRIKAFVPTFRIDRFE